MGNVFYDDTYYQNVLMLYDLVQDNVVIVQYADDKENISPRIQEYSYVWILLKARSAGLRLPGHEFVLLECG